MRKRVVFLMLILSICLIFATGCFDDVSYLTIRFDSNGGTQITELQVESGAKVSRPEDPVKEHYVFDGWYNGDTEWVFETDTVEEDTTLTAKWTPEVYSVTFKNYDGTELAKENVSYGSLPQYSVTPEKLGNAQYSYVFAHWVDENGETVDLANIDRNIILTAEFTETLNKYKVTFKNGDEVLKEEQVEYGTVPTAPETNPAKAFDAENHYVFNGWDNELAAVTGEIVYNAVFSPEAHVYTIDSSDNTFDYLVCSCGYKNETYSYDKTVTSARKELLVSASGLALVIEGASYASVEKMTINGVEISGEITSFAIPDEVKADKEHHGLQNVIVTVKDEQGYSHELQVPVILVTEEIKDMNGLNAALKGEGDEYAVYGYYKLVADLGSPNYNGIQNGSSVQNWQNAGGLYGFRGTFDGNGKSISAIIYANGIFGIVGKGAYIKNLTVNSYNYSNGRTILARTITEATIENVTINVISGSSNSYYEEGGVITALLSHSSKYINVNIKSSSDLDTLFGFSYWNYNPAKYNTFENCTVEAKSIGGIICITTKANMPEPIVPIAGVEGLNVTLYKDAVAAGNMTVGQAAVIELSDLTEITSIVLDDEEFTAYSFENGVLTINADAFTAFQTGNRKFGVTAKNEQGLTVVFEITTTVELVAVPVTLEGVMEIVLSSGTTFDIDLGEYTSATAISATLGGENATYSNGKLTIAEELRANTQKHGMQTLKVTVEKEGKYYAVTVNVLIVTQDITTFEELQSALAFNENNVKFGYYRLKNSLSTNEQYQSGNNVGNGIWKNQTGELGFRGTLDGNNNSIQATFWNTGLFGYVGKGAVIKNITFNMNEYNSNKMLFGYSMIGATVDNVKVNVTQSSGGITAIPGSPSGLLTAIFSYGNTFNNLVVDAQNTDIDTLFGSCAYYSYPAEYEANKFTACTVKAKSLIGIACTDNTNKTVIEPTEIDGLTVTAN